MTQSLSGGSEPGFSEREVALATSREERVDAARQTGSVALGALGKSSILAHMNWIAYSMLMFLSSVGLYLTVRKASLAKIHTHLTNLVMFAIPLVANIGLGIAQQRNFGISTGQAFIILFVAVVFAYGGNTVSLKAIDKAPNPGYSLVLSKSYVLFTTIVAVLLLHAELTTRKAVAIALIVGFSVLIMVNGKTKKNSSNNWVLLSFGAFFAWGLLSLSSKYLFTHGVDTIAFLTYLDLVVTLCIILTNKINLRTLKKLTSSEWKLLIGMGLASTTFNIGQFQAIKLAPNIGYVNAINAGSIALVTVFAVILFKDELSFRKAIGIAGVVGGLILLLI